MGIGLNKGNNWKDLEKPLVSMTIRMVRSNALLLHDIIQAEHVSYKQLAEHGDNHYWYAKMQQWFVSHHININA